MRQERQRLYADMSSEVARVDVDKLRRRAVAAAEKAHSSPTSARSEARCGGAGTRGTARRCDFARPIDNAAGLYLPDRLHEVRIAVKKLRYSLELVRELTWIARGGPHRDAEGGAGPARTDARSRSADRPGARGAGLVECREPAALGRPRSAGAPSRNRVPAASRPLHGAPQEAHGRLRTHADGADATQAKMRESRPHSRMARPT